MVTNDNIYKGLFRVTYMKEKEYFEKSIRRTMQLKGDYGVCMGIGSLFSSSFLFLTKRLVDHYLHGNLERPVELFLAAGGSIFWSHLTRKAYGLYKDSSEKLVKLKTSLKDLEESTGKLENSLQIENPYQSRYVLDSYQ